MAELNSLEYYRDREQRERTLAEQATSPAIAAIHRDLADRYSELTLQAKLDDHQRTLHLG